MPENPITVPLPQDLPTNWAYGQTIGPNGTDVGLPQQYGYNYLMQQVNAAQQAAEELGDGLAGLSGDNIPESAGSETSISTALSNKADKESPQEYALQLSEGYVPGASGGYYYKTQTGIVTLTISDVQKSDGSNLVSGIIGTIPEGFRPKHLISVACSFAGAVYNTLYAPGILQALPNGEVWIGLVEQGCVSIHGQISYIASD